MITRLHVQNYKALRDVTLDLSPLHVLIGPNDSGKSSVLEAAYALVESANRPLVNSFPGLWEGLDLVWNRTPGATVKIVADIENEGKQYAYGFECEFVPNGRTIVLVNDILGTPDEVHSLGRYETDKTRLVTMKTSRGKHYPAELQPLADELESILAGVHSYRWDSRYLAMPAAPDSRWKFRMQPTGFGLPRCLDDILGYDRRRFDQLEAEFLSIFPEFRSIKLEPCPAYQSAPNFVGRDIPSLQQAEGKRIGFELKEGGAVLPASQASDGVLIVLAYLAVMHLPKPPALILIEEPENGIHPKRLQEIVRILRTLIEKNGRTQILMTSHSPYLLDEFLPDEVTLCRKDAHGAVQTRRLSEIEHVRSQLDVFSLGEIWTGEGDDRLAGATPVAEAT